MKDITVTVFDKTLKANYSVPSTVEEYDQLAGKQGACLDAAIDHEIAHGTNTSLRAAMCVLLAGGTINLPGKDEAGNHLTFQNKDESGNPIIYGTRRLLFKNEPVTAEEVEKDGKKTIVYTNSKGKKLTEDQAADVKKETEKNFFDRICAEQGVEPLHFNHLFQQVVAATPFDPSETERKSAEAKIGKTWIKVAEKICAAGNWDKAGREIGALIGRELDTSNPETRVLVLAAAIHENEVREAKLREKLYTAVATEG